MLEYREFTCVDLFAGAGGFTEGFMLAGNDLADFKLLAASDIHEEAELTHRNRFHSQMRIDYDFHRMDIRDVALIDHLFASIKKHSGANQVDVICGGPPCQGFSVFGKRQESDPRNDLFTHYLRVVSELRPKYFVMENVPGLVTMYDGKIPGLIFKEVSRLLGGDYEVSGPIFVNAADFGVPQIRERVLFIGSRKGFPPVTRIPPMLKKSDYLTVADAISDLRFLLPWQTAFEYDKNFPATTPYQTESRLGRLASKLGLNLDTSVLRNHEAAKHTPLVIARFAMLQKGKGFESIPAELWRRHLSTEKKWCIRLDEQRPSNTMTTLPDDFIHYSIPRILTVREMARLQSFDDTFFFEGPRSTGGGGAGNKKRNSELPQYTQVGNAVPPLMAKAIGSALLDCLCSTARKRSKKRSYAATRRIS